LGPQSSAVLRLDRKQGSSRPSPGSDRRLFLAILERPERGNVPRLKTSFDRWPTDVELGILQRPGNDGEGDDALDQPRGRMHRARLEHDTVDLGNEPPLSVDGASDPIDRRRISAQWFS